MADKTKIIIVDDHSMFREGIRLLIEMEGLGVVIAEAENGQDFLNILGNQNPDLVLMDIEMPVMNGVETTQKATAIKPGIKILALSMLEGRENYALMIKAGAMGFVLKSSGKQELEKAINTVMNSEYYFSKEIMHQIIVNDEKQIVSNHSGVDIELTEREMEILQYLSEGLTVKEIADKIFRSVKTIEAHRSKLIEKTDTKNTINLILYAIKNKLVQIA